MMSSAFPSRTAPFRPIRIAMLIPTIAQIGGAERQVLLLAQELARRGHPVTIVALSGSGANLAAINQALQNEALDQSPPREPCPQIEFLSLNMRHSWIDPRGWLRFLAWAHRTRPDILHAHLPHAVFFARGVRLLLPVRVVLETLHTSALGSMARAFLYLLTNGLSNHTTCVGRTVAEGAHARYRIPWNKLSVVFNGVPLPPERVQLITGDATFEWIAVGRLAPVKDYPTLVRAFARLPLEPHLTIAGTGPEEQSLRALAVTLGIADRVAFAGFVPDVQPLLASADAFVLSSRWEGLPVSLLEAAAAGLPSAATDGPGTREAMIAELTGLLVPVGDIDSLADAMTRIMRMPCQVRSSMGQRGRQFIQDAFSLAGVTTQWEALYGELMETNQHPARTA